MNHYKAMNPFFPKSPLWKKKRFDCRTLSQMVLFYLEALCSYRLRFLASVLALSWPIFQVNGFYKPLNPSVVVARTTLATWKTSRALQTHL